MFERIKCYKYTKKSDAVIRHIKHFGELTNDEALIRKANEVLYLNAVTRKKMWLNRKIAVNYNLEVIRRGLN